MRRKEAVSERNAALFGRRLREVRTAKGLSQAQLAEASGMHLQAVARLERGERGPHLDSIIALAKGLGLRITADQLL